MKQLTSLVISNLYDTCAETRPHKYCTKDIIGFLVKEHKFDVAQLKKHVRDVQYLLLSLSPNLMRSTATDGMPWIFARRNFKNEYWCGTLRRVEQLLAMGIALDLVHVTQSSSNAIQKDELPCIIIEDLRIKKELKLNQKRL